MSQTANPIRIKPPVRDRAEDQSRGFTAEQQSAVRILAGDLHRLNDAVMRAVEAGLSIELVRSSRHHSGEGHWGDLMVPVILLRD